MMGYCLFRLIRRISTQENFPRKEKFVKCDWPTQIFRWKKNLKLKIFNFYNDIFGKFSVHGKFSCVCKWAYKLWNLALQEYLRHSKTHNRKHTCCKGNFLSLRFKVLEGQPYVKEYKPIWKMLLELLDRNSSYILQGV